MSANLARSAAKLLQDLRLELHEQSISPELQRRMFEILVESIEARTVECWGVPRSEIAIRYRFAALHEPSALLWSRTHLLHHAGYKKRMFVFSFFEWITSLASFLNSSRHASRSSQRSGIDASPYTAPAN
jgi:hypothetical protein